MSEAAEKNPADSRPSFAELFREGQKDVIPVALG